MIRLIALDLDQTLFGSDLIVSPRVRKAIARAQSAGVLVTIATGRETKLATRFARELNITTPIICAQGGCIYDHVHDRFLHDVSLPARLLRPIMEAARQYGWNIHFETSNRLYLPRDSKHPPAFYELLRYSDWTCVDDLDREMPELPHKLIVTLNQPEDRRRVLEEMQAALGEEVTIVPSHPYLVEALPHGVNKGHGLAWLAKHLNLAQAEVLAIGDSDADVPMLEWAGVGVAMGNGSPAARAAADCIVPPLEEDGAASAIEQFALPS